MSFECISRWLNNFIKVDDDICLKKYDSIDNNYMTNWQSKIRSTLASLAMIVSKTHKTNKRTVIERIQENGWLVTLFYDESIKYHTWGQGQTW